MTIHMTAMNRSATAMAIMSNLIRPEPAGSPQRGHRHE
jgi:hypothetical protein